MSTFNEIESEYHRFTKTVLSQKSLDEIDFIGLNVDEKGAYTFKCYDIADVNCESVIQSHPFVCNVNKLDMLRACSYVRKSDHHVSLQFELGLKNRTNTKMQELMELVRYQGIIDEDQMLEILRASQLPVSWKDNYHNSALFVIGIANQKGIGRILKSYFLPYKSSDPELFYKDRCFDDLYFLSEWQELCPDFVQVIIPYVNIALRIENSHLWMFAIDHAESGWSKYKIYIQNKEANLLQMIGKSMIGEKIVDAAICWQEIHPELVPKGIACCISSDQNKSLNVYYRMISKERAKYARIQ